MNDYINDEGKKVFWGARKRFSIRIVPCLLAVFNLVSNSAIEASECKIQYDSKHFEVRMKNLTLPITSTFYACQQFQVPHDEEYHATVFEPLVENKKLIHHMLLFGCEDKQTIQEAHQCGDAAGVCSSWLAQYTLGLDGNICTHNNTGILFGRNSYKYFLLQIHYNNDKLQSGIEDNSGMRVYFTTNLRRYNAGNVQIGQDDLEIPPGSESIHEKGSCSETCTKTLLPHPIYITRVYLHMHFSGISAKMEVFQGGNLKTIVAEDTRYIYDQSPIHLMSTPVRISPGDEIRVTCNYKNPTNRTFYFGEGSEAEMCYAFVSYYPKVDDFDQCIQISDYDVNCPNMQGSMFIEYPWDQGKYTTTSMKVLQEVTASCAGSDCSTQCITKTKEIKTSLQPKSRARLNTYARNLMNKTTNIFTEEGFYKNLKCADFNK